MASTTGIELGPDSCVLVSVGGTQAGTVDVGALHTIASADWPAQDAALAETLRAVRRSGGFPRRARVVVWGLPDTPAVDAAIARGATAPVVAAGFRVDVVLTPPQALALLAASRPRTSGNAGVAWLALNMHGAAIAIVRGSELLFARTFDWSYDPRLTTPKAQLLQRYSLVAHLAPEVRRGIAEVRASHDVIVEAAVTCGDLPELRSLTMPLIEELDLEVETLDSIDGLRAVGKAKEGRFADAAPAIRLACAVAASGLQRGGSRLRPLLRVAAGVAVVLALGWAGYVYSHRVVVRPLNPQPDAAGTAAATPASQPAAALPPAGVSAPGAVPLPSVESSPAPPLPVSSEGRPPEQQPRVAADTRAAEPRPAVPSAVPQKPVRQAAVPAPPVKLEPRPSATVGSRPSTTLGPGPQPSARVEPKPEPPAKLDPKPAPLAPGTAIDPMWLPPKGTPQSPAAPSAARVPLKDPLPKIDSILIDQDRRLAVIAGKTVGLGDTVGTRVVIQIEPDAVVFREPSGLAVRVELRPKTTR